MEGSSTQQEPLRNASDSNSQDLDTFEIIEVPNRIPIDSIVVNNTIPEISARENEDIEDFADFANESLGIFFFFSSL
jgi:hypothetical protein